MGGLTSFTIMAYAVGLFMGLVGALVAAMLVALVVTKFSARRRAVRTAFWGTFSLVALWVLWALFLPKVNFRIKEISPDGRLKLTLTDVSSELLYDDVGWRMRARLEDAQTGECLASTVVRYWHSGFDDLGTLLPGPQDVAVHWRLDGGSVLIEYGGAWVVLPEGTEGAHSAIPQDIRQRYGVRHRIEQRR